MLYDLPIIKVDATDSTNALAKSMLVSKKELHNFCVYTPIQRNGKGQMGAKWLAEPNKNLTCTVVFRNLMWPVTNRFLISILVSLALLEVLYKYTIPQLKLKWPNDILSGEKKIGGILIENSLQGDFITNSIIGIGLNLNQTDFGNIYKASSLKKITGRQFTVEEVLHDVVNKLKKLPLQLKTCNYEEMTNAYQNKLFRFEKASMFEHKNGETFVGIIKKVNSEGNLVVQLEDNHLATFEVKEITLKY